MAIDGVYQKRVMNLTDDDIYHIKGSKKNLKTLFSAKPSSLARKRWMFELFFLLDWKVSIHELKNSPTSSLF